MAAAVATLLDRGAVWEFDLDPGRRIVLASYWTLHALLLALIVLSYRSLERRKKPALITFASILGFVSLITSVSGLIFAGIGALARLAVANNFPHVPAIAVALLLLFMFRRMFRNSQREAFGRDDNDHMQTWSEVLKSIAIVPVALAVWVAMVTLFGATWHMASTVLDYALLGHDPAVLDWSYPLERFASRIDYWEVDAIIGGILILAIIFEKLFPATVKGPADGAQ